MTSKYHSVNNLKVSEELLLFVNNELFKGTDISPEKTDDANSEKIINNL